MEKKELEHERQKLVKSLPDLSQVVRGSVVERYLRCGKQSCKCQEGKGHGPYNYLMTTLTSGRTRMVLLSPDQVEMVTAWVANFKKLKEDLERINEINATLIQLERQATKAQSRSRKR